ncbi:hypothetical protein PROFUN_10497 [Planoprotostelium fungivorum]|uniref:Uncharacterized protein n=1 Tax=Planoprotostelium fungivorum TaxID=1890364 RepID=A0A2P6NDG0_9EUKA|nr:hypothetical protein PROFUN_10497 [Planoprotostelium fungivorum]
MLMLELTPGRSLGSFYLGMPISEAISYIQQKNKTISHAELKYSDTKPLSVDIVVDLNEDGIMLRFEPSTQKLCTLEVYQVPRVILSYSGIVFNSSDRPPTLVNIYETFGPTHPGVYDPQNGIYSLHYPGLSFSFPIPKKYENLYMSSTEIPPMEFPDRSTPVTCRIHLYSGSIHQPQVLDHPPTSLYYEPIEASVTRGLYFTKRKCGIDFSSSTQDVLSILGTPSRVFYKAEDKMRIHTNSYNGLGCADYFYNYFQMGFDILFDIRTHRVKKFILHTNFPSHVQFNQYPFFMCNFQLKLDGVPKGSHREDTVVDAEKSEKSDEKIEGKEEFIITPNTQWTTIQQEMGGCGKPVVHNRGSNTNPFGATLFYGYKGLIFEVMQNDHIATCYIFQSDTTK